MAMPARASAQAGSVKMPAVIGYPNEKGVTIERVTYPARNMGTTIVANLFKPAGFTAEPPVRGDRRHPPVRRRQGADGGPLRPAARGGGLVALAYDAWYQGESGGEPRLMEVPAQRLDDISCAIDFLVQHPQVDPERIGSLGICAGGGYALCHAQTELRVKAVAAVSTFNLGEARREGMGTISYEERMKRLRDAGEARSREARGEPVRLVPWCRTARRVLPRARHSSIGRATTTTARLGRSIPTRRTGTSSRAFRCRWRSSRSSNSTRSPRVRCWSSRAPRRTRCSGASRS